MKQPIKVFIFLVLTSLTFTRCGREVIEVDRHFLGIWNGTSGAINYRISIDNGSNGYWHAANKGSFQTGQGVAREKHNKLYIGLKKFEISQYPTLDSAGIWTMTLSGITYQRQ